MRAASAISGCSTRWSKTNDLHTRAGYGVRFAKGATRLHAGGLADVGTTASLDVLYTSETRAAAIAERRSTSIEVNPCRLPRCVTNSSNCVFL